MVTYCTGDPGLKRKNFRAQTGGEIIYCDNDEISPPVKGCGKMPFGGFTVLEFIRYARALKDNAPLNRTAVLRRLRAAGVKRRLNCKLRRLSAVEYRAVSLSAKAEDDTRVAYLNFDGLAYGLKNRRILKRFLNVWEKRYKVFVSVSDKRFMPKNSTVLNFEKKV